MQVFFDRHIKTVNRYIISIVAYHLILLTSNHKPGPNLGIEISVWMALQTNGVVRMFVSKT